MLLEWKASLESAERIPLEVDTAFRARLGSNDVEYDPTKASSSENQAVNEGGVAAYNVLKTPDAFLKFKDKNSGTIYSIPSYTP